MVTPVERKFSKISSGLPFGKLANLHLTAVDNS